MRLMYLVFGFLCLIMLVVPGFSKIGNSDQCRAAKGKCVKRRCPGSYKRIGNCSKKVACCRK